MKPREIDQLPILPNVGLEAPMELLFDLEQSRQLIPVNSIEYLRTLIAVNKSNLSEPKYTLHGCEHRRHRMLTLSDLQILRGLVVHTAKKDSVFAVKWIAENFDELSLQAEITDRNKS